MEASPQQIGSFPHWQISSAEIIQTHTYVGTVFEDSLRFNRNTDVIVKKAQQHFYCLRELNSFGADQTMLSALLIVF